MKIDFKKIINIKNKQQLNEFSLDKPIFDSNYLFHYLVSIGNIDALKLENVATVNPLYGLTGYSVIQTSGAATIVKSPNTSNYVEFRFSVDLSSGNNS